MTLSIDLALRKARQFASNGQTTEAEKSYREILALFPSNRRALDGLRALLNSTPAIAPNQDIQYLIDLYSRGKLKEALDWATQLIQRYPQIVLIYNIAGAAHLGLRRLDEALASFDEAVRQNPDLAEGHNNRGIVLAELRRLDEALASHDAAIRLKPDYADAHYNRGVTLADLTQLEDAIASYDEAIRLKPDYAIAFNNRGNALAHLKRLDEALASFDAAIRLQPNNAAVYANRGNALKGLKRLDDALADFEQAIRLQPHNPEAHNNRGNALQILGRRDEALSSYDAAIRLQPDFADAYNNRGVVLADLERAEEALVSFDQAIRIKPGFAMALNNRGHVLKALDRPDEALASFNEAISLNPDFADAYNNRGVALADLKRPEEALASYDKAIRSDPTHAEARNNRGNALKALNRLDEALASYDEAIRLKPDHPQTHHNRGAVLADLKRLDEALASYDEALRLQPDRAETLTQQLHLRAQICDWADHAHAIDLSRLGVDGDAVAPFTVLASKDDPIIHLERAKTWARQKYAPAPTPSFRSVWADGKLKVGYFSADFHDHATMYLMAELFELHDREKFEIHAFSYGLPSQDKMRRRLIKAVDHFHDVSRLTDRAIAAFARSPPIDHAKDMKGYTTNTRSGLFAYRAAPIQVSYLGYPGSMGANFMDYIIADETIIPQHCQNLYSEKVIYLPNSYQVNDRAREISDQPFNRAARGLPNDRFVFCCFNNNYKITSAEFDIWMRLLARVEASVLWLLKDNPWAQANLRREAVARGIDADRLVFAQRTRLPDHLARHRCADLFLDTFNYNAHTTASDALWAGLPMVTKLGEGFPSRVGGSLLRAVGLAELVTDTPEAYEQLALELATNPDRLADIRERLATSRLTKPLFDTERFTRHIEHAYQLAHGRYSRGLPPDHIKTPDAKITRGNGRRTSAGR